MVLLNLILEFLIVVLLIFFFLSFYDAYRWESNKFKRFDKMLHNDIRAYLAEDLEIQLYLREKNCEETDESGELTGFNRTSLKNRLYFEEIWYHPRIEEYVDYAVPVFRFKQRNFFSKKKYRVQNEKRGFLYNYDLLWDKTTARVLFSKRAYFLMHVNAKYQTQNIHSFEKYHSNYFIYKPKELVGLIGIPFFLQDAFHYMLASYKGREPYGMEEPEQVRPVNYYLHTTRGVIDLVGDAEVKRKPKDLTNRIPTDLSEYPQWDTPVPYLGKELFKDYWDCPEKATGLFQRAMDYYLKYVRPREIAAAEQAAAEKAAEEQYQAALKRSF